MMYWVIQSKVSILSIAGALQCLEQEWCRDQLSQSLIEGPHPSEIPLGGASRWTSHTSGSGSIQWAIRSKYGLHEEDNGRLCHQVAQFWGSALVWSEVRSTGKVCRKRISRPVAACGASCILCSYFSSFTDLHWPFSDLLPGLSIQDRVGTLGSPMGNSFSDKFWLDLTAIIDRVFPFCFFAKFSFPNLEKMFSLGFKISGNFTYVTRTNSVHSPFAYQATMWLSTQHLWWVLW